MDSPAASAVERDDDSSAFAVTVASAPPCPDASAAPADATPALPGAGLAPPQVGRYELRQRLGEGGLGMVHEAWDPVLSRTVALKTLQLGAAGADRLALDRLFLHEARAVANLKHPHIVTVHDAGLSPQGVYIAMERLQGRDLRQALASGWRPTPPQAAQLVRRVADALAYAHARGVVHCDIKPANIFLTRRDKPTVLDFGIARVAHGAQAGAGLDDAGVVAGSPHYLAPEQLQGGAIDQRTDVYALGVVLYELLAGRKAFEGGSLEQIVTAVLHGHPAPAHEVRTEVPAGLAAIAARAMARDPAQRHRSAAELAQALRPWQTRSAHDEPPADAAPAAAAGRAAKASGSARAARSAKAARVGAPWTHWRRPAVRAAAAGAVAGLALLGGLGGLSGWGSIAGLTGPGDPAATKGAAEASVVADGPTAGAATTAPDAAPPPSAAEPPPVSAAEPPAPPRRAARAARPVPPVAAPALPPVPPPPAPPTGEVRLAISPWGEIEVDGRPAGVAPPLARLELSEGTHQVTVRNGDFPPYRTQVTVDPGQPVVIRHRFGP